MPISQAMCTSFKVELLRGIHDFTASTGDVFKLALYTSSANLDASTTAYSATNEVASSGSYSAGGGTLTNITPTSSSTTALTDFDDLSFTTTTLTSRGALIYNSTDSNRAVAVLDFGSDKTVTAGTFTVQFPAATSADAIIRIS